MQEGQSTKSSSINSYSAERPNQGPAPRSGCVNHTTIEDIPEEEEVLAGTFLLFGRPIIILFDSGASHNFMSVACAKRSKLALTMAKPSYMISTPGG
jgi:hypothetical protein